MKTFFSLLFVITLQTCISSTPPFNNSDPVWTPTQTEQNGMKKAYFASGCFWCVEAIYESVKGVSEVYSGYAGGQTKNPNYNQIGTGKTGHAEAVEVIYDPKVVSFATLVQVFFGSHDPTTPTDKVQIMDRNTDPLPSTPRTKNVKSSKTICRCSKRATIFPKRL